ncbi:Spindle pole body component [Pleurostoma richardsiae]|uniref:Spindle pole body component n=1 Tax=Pleurostoma richardsiae TaxID=41990 RepID=A0AA38RBD8_9PEZI|nr:Spindle pole body component [Pleurostoma richardsiae]
MQAAPDNEDVSHVFAIPDFWKSPRLLDEAGAPEDGLPVNLFQCMVEGDAPNAKATTLGLDGDSFFRLPPLLASLPEDETLESQVSDVENADVALSEETDNFDDLWLLDSLDSIERPKLLTWDSFTLPDAKEETPLFITEAGPAAFDALLASEDSPFTSEPHEGNKTLQPSGFCSCLLALALGRASILFSWSDEKKTFVPTLSSTKVTGYSGVVLRGITKLCLDCGSANRLLRYYVEAVYLRHASQSEVALANAVDKLLLVVQSELGGRGRSVRSLLQLQDIVQPVHALTAYLKSLVGKLPRGASDEEALAVIFEEAQSVEYGEGFLRDTLREILVMVSKPWTNFVEEWIGLREEQGLQLTKDGLGKGFVKVHSQTWADELGLDLEERDYFFDEEKMPNFMPADVARAIFETGRNIRFLRENHSGHPLAHVVLGSVQESPTLEWQFDWEAITKIEEKALAYEEALSEAIRRHHSDEGGHLARQRGDSSDQGASELQFLGRSEEDIETRLLASMAEIEQPIKHSHHTSRLSAILKACLFNRGGDRQSMARDITPHWSLLPLLSFGPIVSAQSRLVNRECLRLLFSTHELREHLNLLREFSLFGNGVFSSRLSHALFDPDLDATERKAGAFRSGGTMGLRLGRRDNWPPASSELRLALMGVLAESYIPKSNIGKRSEDIHYSKGQLPGDMSFAVRDLSAEDMERCMDPDSLEALDFLQLTYKPPSALRPIMTPGLLVKYDRIFKHLLRVLRMVYIMNQMFSETGLKTSQKQSIGNAVRRFQIESHHFISSVATYFLDTGVSMPWRDFEAWIDGVEASLQPAAAGASQHNCSPVKLRDYHDQTLDDIMRALLLRKRQQPVLGLLDDIFASILQFTKTLRESRQDDNLDDAEGKIKGLYSTFRKKVEVFITVCRGLGEKASYETRHDKRSDATRNERMTEENPIMKLVLMLDMSNYYTRRES